MKCRQAMHKYRLFPGIFHDLAIHLIGSQLTNPAFPYVRRFSHGYPYIRIDYVGSLRSFIHVLRQGNRCTGFLCDTFTLCYQYGRRKIFFSRTGRKMHPHLCTGYHQGIPHIVARVSHVCKLNSFYLSKMLPDCQQISQHLCRMILVRKPIPYRDSGMFCQFFYDFLPISPVLNTLKHPSKYPGSIGNTLFFSYL